MHICNSHKQVLLGGTACLKRTLDNLNLHHFYVYCSKKVIKDIALDFKSHWLHDATVIPVTCLHRHSLAVVGSRTGIEAPIRSNELLFKRLPSQDLQCRNIIASAVRYEEFFHRQKHEKASEFAILSPFNQ